MLWHARDIFERFASFDVPPQERWTRERLEHAATGEHCLGSRARAARLVLRLIDSGLTSEAVWQVLGGDR